MWKSLVVLAVVANTALISLAEAQSCKERHEIFSRCSNLICRPLHCFQVGFPRPCAFPPDFEPVDCTGGIHACICEKGYARNRNGKCIPIEKCPSCGGDPYAISGCGVNCDRHCSDLNNTEPAVCPKICKENGCDCRKGYLFDDNTGKCVRPRDCTPSCGKDEVYSTCIQGDCAPKTCSEIGYPMSCPRIYPAYCIKGCLCKEGYVRDENGTCIPKDQCPSCGGDPNAVSGCGVNCGRYCSNYYSSEPVACPEFCNINGCDCKEGFVVDDNTGKCIPPSECVLSCGEDEVYSACVQNACVPTTCLESGYPFGCREVDPNDCIKGCLCKEGYVWDANDTCIPKDQCPRDCPENEVYDSCANGGCGKWNCSQLGEPDLCIDPYICLTGCICKEGYLRTENGTCVPIDQCPPPECGINERLEDCPEWLCRPQYCFQVGYPIDCPAYRSDSTVSPTCPGSPGCVCIDGYARDDNGQCIPVDQCPSCGGDPNAVQGCGINCGRFCSNYKEKNVICPLRPCFINSCDCREGYVYDSNVGRCVLPIDCTPTCEINEVYDFCANDGCQKRKCSQIDEPAISIDPVTCYGGCVCQEGYLRLNNGTCVLECQCPRKCTRPHEVLNLCPRTCPPQTCYAISIGFAYDCAPPPQGEEFCHPACVCEDGYYRNSVDECISEANCYKCNKPNEHFSCGPECDNECARLSTWNQTNCPIENIKCVEKCYCDEGYARDDNNICIPIDQCNVSCSGDTNAVPGCGVNCGRHCSDYDKGVVACPPHYMLDGCDCKTGYVYDDYLGKCVLPENCTLCTGPHEYFSCGGACDNVCLTLNEQSKDDCPIINIQCNEMCYCEDGYARNESNICIPIKDCPPPRCSNDERWEDNPCQMCDPLTCSEVGETKECPPVQYDFCDNTPTCVCKYGLVRNDNGDCIPSSECYK